MCIYMYVFGDNCLSYLLFYPVGHWWRVKILPWGRLLSISGHYSSSLIFNQRFCLLVWFYHKSVVAMGFDFCSLVFLSCAINLHCSFKNLYVWVTFCLTLSFVLQVDRLICHLCTSIETKLMRCVQLAPFKAEDTDSSDGQKVIQRTF